MPAHFVSNGWVIAGMLLAAGFVHPITLHSQSTTFEVATVKPLRAAGPSTRYPSLRNGTLGAENVSLKTLLAAAYGLSALRITGPDWLDSDKFDIAAKTREVVPDSELMPLLQSLLKERFQVATHRDNKEMQAYDMVAAQSGVKLEVFDPANPPKTPPNAGGSLLIGVGTMAQIADSLARIAGRPVVDRTRLEGRFFFAVNYAPLSTQPADGGAGTDLPDFFAAVQEQLGLRLQSRKQPIEILIVDHAERIPVEN